MITESFQINFLDLPTLEIVVIFFRERSDIKNIDDINILENFGTQLL